MNYELDSEPDTWRRRRSSPKPEIGYCPRIPRRSSVVAVVVLGLAVLSCLFGYCVLSETAPYDAKTLRLLLIIFRHGARTPTHSYNSDPYKNYNWPDGLGSLTNVGKLQLYELGKKLRNYYGSFLPDEYLDKDAYIISSDSPRCLMSAYTLLAGLYPPGPRQLWHPDIPWQPVPVHSIPRDMDSLMACRKPCKNLEKQLQDVYSEVNSRPEYSSVFNYLTKHCNQSYRTVLDAEFLFSTLKVQQDAGLKLPEWTRNVYPDKIREMAEVSLALFTHNTTMKRFRSGPLLSDLLKKIQDKVGGSLKPDRSLFLYSSHDITVVNTWRGLGFEELLLPQYGASLVLELHQDEGSQEHYVKAFYWNHTKVEAPTELRLPLCGDPCTFSDFQSSLKPFIPLDWDAECNK